MADQTRRTRARTPRLAPIDFTRLTDQATLNSYRLAELAGRVTPGFVAAGLAVPFGAGASLTDVERRRMIERHLRRVDPTMSGLRLRQAVRDAFDSYARYWIESFRLPTLSRRHVAANFRHDGYEEYVVPALAQGNGAILALPHLGGWEWAGRWIADRGHRITVVVEQIDPPELFEWFVDLRSKLGMNVVPLGPGAGATITKALRDNHIVCLLCDRDLQRKGPEVEFFGERTRLPGGPATIALRTGAPLLPTAVYFTDRLEAHLGYVRAPIDARRTDARLRDDVERVTAALAGELEILIRRAPSQWHLFQPNWPSDPGYRR